ncbi:DUF4238 domain-containing protein [Bradyrhizobium sp. 6(2017)]|uniref:DUF4238 domain-containing protein n=1 Tax=Bradyrhizobium sp. 6(2017) TaxID=1197460 RepID=UPI0013E18638|nr:DUF4238 domain-containing protein [Bradyrhizobium sp. 6(2017)]QIG93492.1 DUF4238 domain-containing protein [Bradyrhizobium sp. 6(2017)]
MTSSAESSGAQAQVPFKPVYPPLTRAAVRKLFPESALEVIDPLATIWDEVVHRIVVVLMELAANDAEPLHINLREEWAFELAKLTFWLGEGVVKKRLADRDPSVVGIEQERYECLGTPGAKLISNTARLVQEHIWKKLLTDWKRKSEKALEREANPRPTKLAIQRVETNHFIPRSFIRDYWAVGGKILRWRRVDEGWSSASRSFGQWGFRPNLYSDWLEAYFGLLECDAKLPVQNLLNTRPLNAPQREALVGFLAIQLLRSPAFIERIRQSLSAELGRLGYSTDPEMLRKAYETLYRNNDLYHRLAHPVMWSRWAIVKAQSPLFILPDTFCAHGGFGDGLRLVAPLTPRVCFVTLPTRETEKRIIPLQLCADERLARRISSILIRHAESEFLSHADFRPDEQQIESASVGSILNEVEDAIGGRIEH